jgi:hypothetical protein
MCKFNFAIFDSDTDNRKIKEILERHKLRYQPIILENFPEAILSTYKLISTTMGNCDCGSVIGYDLTNDDFKINLEKETKRLRRMKWSENKIKNSLEGRLKSQNKTSDLLNSKLTSELNNWMGIIEDCFSDIKIRKIGIFTHFFSGNISNEDFKTVVVKEVTWKGFNPNMLRKIPLDEILIINNK